MRVEANSEAEAKQIVDNVESNLNDTLGHCPHSVTLEYYKDSIEEQ